MNIFLPYKQPENSFFEEIIPHSKNIFTYGTFLEFDKCYETVVIQWPELIFEWKEPTETDLHTLETEIQTWKKTARIIYVVHNLERHYGMTSAFKALYDIVQTNCDVMVHFGNASRNIFRKKYPSKLHRVINHPLYLNSFCSFSFILKKS